MPEKRTRTRRLTRVGFDTTNWTLVMTAVDGSLPGSRPALEELCQKYWRPVYAFLRQQGQSGEDAQDLTQGFFLHLLQKDRLRRIHPSKGRLRSFFLAALQNYVQDQRQWARAQKRGGGRIPIPLDLVDAVEATDPSLVFDQSWAGLLFGRAVEQTRQKCESEGKAQWFEAVRGFLTGEAERGDYSRVASQLHINESALRTGVSRLRAAVREQLRAEVGRTVADPSDIEEEVRYVLKLAGVSAL
jgi:RNA polymerase sigma-70 factor (ECF subfamily)